MPRTARGGAAGCRRRSEPALPGRAALRRPCCAGAGALRSRHHGPVLLRPMPLPPPHGEPLHSSKQFRGGTRQPVGKHRQAATQGEVGAELRYEAIAKSQNLIGRLDGKERGREKGAAFPHLRQRGPGFGSGRGGERRARQRIHAAVLAGHGRALPQIPCIAAEAARLLAGGKGPSGRVRSSSSGHARAMRCKGGWRRRAPQELGLTQAAAGAARWRAPGHTHMTADEQAANQERGEPQRAGRHDFCFSRPWSSWGALTVWCADEGHTGAAAPAQSSPVASALSRQRSGALGRCHGHHWQFLIYREEILAEIIQGRVEGNPGTMMQKGAGV